MHLLGAALSPTPFWPAPSWPTAVIVAVAAFLLGSIPFGLVLTKIAGLGDIRRIGSGNIGATNVLRTGHKGLAMATLLLDGGKGWLAVALAWHFAPAAATIAALAVVIGHVFPPWLRFNGGKGVATSAGMLLAYAWPAGLATVLTWLIAAVGTRYSSLAAIIAAALAPLYTWLATGRWQPTAAVVVVVLLVLLRHSGNIRRLCRGEETRIRLRRAAR